MQSNDLILLFGGTSHERRVSVASAQHVAELLPHAQPWFITPEGAVHSVTSDELRRFERPFENDFKPSGPRLADTLEGAALTVKAQNPTFLLALHGGEGEDGTYQRMFAKHGLAFTGSDADASWRAFDKQIAKQTARSAGVLTAEAMELPESPNVAREELQRFFARAGRLVVKPVADGSSVGLHHIRAAGDIEGVIQHMHSHPTMRMLAESFIEGTEMTIGVVEDERGIRALPASEVRVVPGGAFDFQGKYLGKGVQEITPAEVPPEVSKAAQQLAVTMHKSLGCMGYSRTDVIATTRGPVFLETNTLPGMTKASFIPQQLAAEGTPMLTFLEGQLALARKRRDSQKG